MTRLALALTAALLVIVRPVIGAQWMTNAGATIFAPANDVSFTFSTDRASYAVPDDITLKWEIVNVGPKAIYVPRQWSACPATPHVMAWLEDSEGQHSHAGYAGSCGQITQTVVQRMSKEAVLLQPGDHFEGTRQLGTNGLSPGKYRVEAVLYGWTPQEFTEAEQAEMAKMAGRFLRGEVPASARITLTR
jgi:hypothetical protein